MKRRSLIRWQHRLNRERPTCTERNDSLLESADGSMATAANGREEKRVEQHETRIPLTPTGLLMEGHFTHRRVTLSLRCANHVRRNGTVALWEYVPERC